MAVRRFAAIKEIILYYRDEEVKAITFTSIIVLWLGRDILMRTNQLSISMLIIKIPFLLFIMFGLFILRSKIKIVTLRYIKVFKFIFYQLFLIISTYIIFTLICKEQHLIDLLLKTYSVCISLNCLVCPFLLMKKDYIKNKLNMKETDKIQLSSYKYLKLLLLTTFHVISAFTLSYFRSDFQTVYLVIIIFSSWIWSMLCFFPYQLNDITQKINISFLNLDITDVLANKCYLNNSLAEYKHYRVFKIDFSEIFPANSIRKNVKIINHPFVYHLKNNEKKENKYCYFIISGDEVTKMAKVEILLSFVELTDRLAIESKTMRLNLYFEFTNFNGQLMVSDKYVSFYQKIWFKLNKKEFPLWKQENFSFEKVHKNCYQYPEEILSASKDTLTNIIIDNRKWVHHEGDYGEGKTTLDILSVSDNGLKPIIISPWSQNYDFDLLSLVFKKMNESSKIMFHWPDKFGFHIFIAELIVFCTTVNLIIVWVWDFLVNILQSNVVFFSKWFNVEILLSLKDEYPWVISTVAILLGIVISIFVESILLPELIIKKNGSTKYYQSFFLKEIKRMLLKEKMVLIIEDIDRLNGEALDNMFRTISAINETCFQVKRLIGIISYSRENIATLVEEGKHNNILNDIENKIIYSSIFENYSYKDAMRIYLIESMKAIVYFKEKSNLILSLKLNNLIKSLDFKDHNFRDVHSFLDLFFKLNNFNQETVLFALENFFIKKEKNILENKSETQI